MEQRIKRIVMYLKALYVFCWAVPLLVGIASEMDTPWLGILAGDVRATYGVETLVILLTVVCVPLSLKLFAWSGSTEYGVRCGFCCFSCRP